MNPVSFLQRFVEDALSVGFTTVKNTATGAGRSYKKGKGWQNRLEDMRGAWDFSTTKDAAGDLYDSFATASSGWGKVGAVVGAPFRAAHTVAGVGTDILRGIGGTAGTIAGTAAGAATAGTAMVAGGIIKHGLLKPGWALTKAVAPGLMKNTAKATYAGAHVAVRDGGTIAAAGAKFLWQTRKSPVVGSALVGGAIALGASHGNKEYEEQAMHGHPYGGKQSSHHPERGQIKNMGYMNAEITGGAWQLMPSADKMAPQLQDLQRRANEQGGYEAIESTRGNDSLGATGDLVFALNQLRQGGLF